jgi:hypothetical protein
MKAPMAMIPFRLYITAKDAIIGVVLTQVTEGKEHIITYMSRRLIDAESRDEITVVNDLVQQASSFRLNGGKFSFLESRMF